MVVAGSFIFLLAGFATGIVTGLVGASAIVVFVPIILLFLNYSLYALVGVSLSVDVFVSLFAWIIYRKFKHIDFKTGFYLSILAVIGAIIGSLISRSLPSMDLLGVTSVVTALTGIMLFRRKTKPRETYTVKDYSKSKLFIAIILSFVIGLFGGAAGSAGGILIFLLLIFFLNFETHRAIGTSIFVMSFIALSGSVAHIKAITAMGFHWILLVYAVVGGVIGSLFSATLANVSSEKKLNKAVGIILFVLGTLTFIRQLFP